MNLAVIGGSAWFVGTLTSLLEQDEALRSSEVFDGIERITERAAAEGVEIAILACPPTPGETQRLVSDLRRRRRGLRVIANFPTLRADLVRDAMQAGAWGCFSAEDAPEVVLNVLRAVAGGCMSFPFVDLSRLDEDPFERLTRREMEVLQALAQGWSNLQISARLGISENTVKYHLKLVYDKLGVQSRAMAVAQYMAHVSG